VLWNNFRLKNKIAWTGCRSCLHYRKNVLIQLDVFCQPYKLLKLRNPWGAIEWRGRAGNGDRQFWDQIDSRYKDDISYDKEQGGTFFILWEDFVKYFRMIDICQINDNANYLFV